MSDSNIAFTFRVIVHTCQMLSSEMPLPIEAVNKKPYIIKPKARQTDRGYLYPLNVNKAFGVEISSLVRFLSAIERIQANLGISEWQFDRLDIAFDTTLKYDDIYKYSLYIISLVSAITGIKNAIDIQDVNTKRKRALTIKRDGRNAFELQIYNKALESDNKHPYSRFEFRYKNINGKDVYSVLEQLRSLISGLLYGIEVVERQRVSALYELWQTESGSGNTTQTKNLSEFVRRYSNDLFTREIVKGLYSKIHSGKFTEWLKYFRRNNRILFIEKTEIETIVETMKKALDGFIEAGEYPSPVLQEKEIAKAG
ncbi:hypothetical protein [Harryflintia acetispora]|uniref:Replication initiation protein n=1 Tax=Harryflintia acetispora TaxID=1849041 RepID=A0A9X8Y901_9FIRM|nr:hypothetical protein [Harryflintia acetispora]TCL44460.1 hypothetical protein EDD78_10278 [Harryflintia acetispora]